MLLRHVYIFEAPLAPNHFRGRHTQRCFPGWPSASPKNHLFHFTSVSGYAVSVRQLLAIDRIPAVTAPVYRRQRSSRCLRSYPHSTALHPPPRNRVPPPQRRVTPTTSRRRSSQRAVDNRFEEPCYLSWAGSGHPFGPEVGVKGVHVPIFGRSAASHFVSAAVKRT